MKQFFRSIIYLEVLRIFVALFFTNFFVIQRMCFEVIFRVFMVVSFQSRHQMSTSEAKIEGRNGNIPR